MSQLTVIDPQTAESHILQGVIEPAFGEGLITWRTQQENSPDVEEAMRVCWEVMSAGGRVSILETPRTPKVEPGGETPLLDMPEPKEYMIVEMMVEARTMTLKPD